MPPAGWRRRWLEERFAIGKTDIGFLINEFAKPDFSQHLSLREQAARERGCRGNQRR
jgi:hypothetical protein